MADCFVKYQLYCRSNDRQCTTGNHYYHKYLKTKCALKCVVGDTECVVGDTKVKLECGKGFWALKVLRSRRSHTPLPLVKLLVGDPLLSLELTLPSHFPPLKFVQFAQFTGACLCQQSISPL